MQCTQWPPVRPARRGASGVFQTGRKGLLPRRRSVGFGYGGSTQVGGAPEPPQSSSTTDNGSTRSTGTCRALAQSYVSMRPCPPPLPYYPPPMHSHSASPAITRARVPASIRHPFVNCCHPGSFSPTHFTFDLNKWVYRKCTDTMVYIYCMCANVCGCVWTNRMRWTGSWLI